MHCEQARPHQLPENKALEIELMNSVLGAGNKGN